MADVVVTDLNPRKKRGRAANRLRSKRVRGADGKQATVYVLETDRPDIGEQLRTVFQLNVDRARRKAGAVPVAAE